MNGLKIGALVVLLSSGCQTAQLQKSTELQAKSVTNLYYDQILSNIAMLASHPSSLPYFSLPQTGQNSTQFSFNLNYTPTWDLITGASTRFLGRYLLDKQSAAVTGGDTNIETWNTNPTIDPDKILLMKYAYEHIFGNYYHNSDLLKVLEYRAKVVEASQEKPPTPPTPPVTTNINSQEMIAMLHALYDYQLRLYHEQVRSYKPSLSVFNVNYATKLHTGWFGVGTKHDVPKDACYVGHCGKTYAWVMPGNEEALADFALVILDITSYEAPDRQPRTGTPATTGRASTR